MKKEKKLPALEILLRSREGIEVFRRIEPIILCHDSETYGNGYHILLDGGYYDLRYNKHFDPEHPQVTINKILLNEFSGKKGSYRFIAYRRAGKKNWHWRLTE